MEKITHKLKIEDSDQDLLTVGVSVGEHGIGDIKEVNIGAPGCAYMIGKAFN